VRERSLEINSFELPGTLLREMLDHDCWELMVMRSTPTPPTPVAFGAHFIGAHHYAPMIIGLTTSTSALTTAIDRRSVKRSCAPAHITSDRILLGMGASLEKHRFGASVEHRCAYAQSGEHYSQEVLAGIAAESLAAA